MRDFAEKLSHLFSESWVFIITLTFLLLLAASMAFEALSFATFPLQWMGAVLIAGYLLLFNKRILALITFALVPLSISSGADTVFSMPSELLMGFLAIACVAWASTTLKLNKYLLLHPLTLLLGADLFWMLITSLNSTMPIVSLKRFAVRVCFLLVWYLFFAIINNRQKKFGVRAFLLYATFSIVPIFYATYKHIPFDFSPAASIYLAQPFFAEHTLYGAIMAFLFICTGVAFYYYKELQLQRFPGRPALGILLGILLLGLILSYSRAAWLSVGFACFFFFLIQFRIKMPALLTGIFILAGTISVFWTDITNYAKENEAVSSRGGAEEHLQSVTNLESDASNLERINRWSCAIRMFMDKPILGFGPGTYQFKYGPYQVVEEMTPISTYDGDKGNSHSEYLTYLSEMGLPGLIIFFGWILMSFIIGLRIIYQSVDPFSKAFATAILLGLTTFYFHSFFNSFMDADEAATLVFAGLAVLATLDLNTKRLNQTQTLD